MSNTTKKSDRVKWIARANQLIEMDADTRVTNVYAVLDQLMREFSISRDSARTALAHAARQRRSKTQ